MFYGLEDLGQDGTPLYGNRANPVSHPNQMAVVARLQGIQPPALAGCRVLELGCANGGNLLPLAESMPDSDFLGVDRALRPVDDAGRIGSKLGIENVQFACESFENLDASIGQFDYVLCHGVFCWTTPNVQEHILRICRDLLKPNGLAHIHLNVVPGSWLGDFFRAYLQTNQDRSKAPLEQVTDARRDLEFMSKAFVGNSKNHTATIRAAAARLLQITDVDLFHAYLGVKNYPIPFMDFLAQAREHGLTYIADLAPSFQLRQSTSVTWSEYLPRDSDQREQTLDYLENRGTRHCLIGRAPELAPTITPPGVSGNIDDFYVVGYPHPVDPPKDAPPNAFAFQSEFGRSAVTKDPRVAVILNAMGDQKTPITVGQLKALANQETLPDTLKINSIEEELVALAAGRFLQLSVAMPKFTANATHPKTTAFSRYQLDATNGLTTTLRHEVVKLSEQDQTIFQLLDGRNSAASVATAVGMPEVDILKAFERMSKIGLFLAT